MAQMKKLSEFSTLASEREVFSRFRKATEDRTDINKDCHSSVSMKMHAHANLSSFEFSTSRSGVYEAVMRL